MANKKNNTFKEIIIHWTAGVYNPNEIDKKAYHYLVTGQGNMVKGLYSPEDNLNCSDGKYAQHCGGGNTGRIGVAMCGMMGYTPTNYTLFPLTLKQVEATCQLVAEIMLKYNLPYDNVRTHAEFGEENPNTSSYGKIDIIELPCINIKGTKNVGDVLRNKVKWYYFQLKEGKKEPKFLKIK